MPIKNCEVEKNNIVPNTEPSQCNSPKPFYGYHLKSLLIFLIYLIVIKYIQNILKQYCFAKDGCDCSDNSLIVKIFTMILTQHYIGHII